MSSAAFALISPCYNEGTTVIRFLERIESETRNLPQHFEVIIVDDCSSDHTLELLKNFSFQAPNLSLSLLHLRFNVGHQAAIFQGLLFASKQPFSHFIVMDSDGEDSPRAIPELIRHSDYDIVHVVRGKRRESTLFKISYWFYKASFRFITGKRMNFGNYCMISRMIAESAVFHSFTHFAAFLSKQRGTRTSFTWEREKRIDGKSKMSYKNLLSHAFKSFVEYGEDLLMVFLKSFIVIMLLFVAAISNVIYQKFVADTAILGWTSVVAIGLLNMAIIAIGFFVLGILLLHVSHQKNPNSRTSIYDEVARQS
ncbi:MAG: glycosyltransferase [Bacteroidetes bacterium]|nr:glycosyltransferase [Bacteroidota bacterium]MBS1630251.1 glycosyltransferase [Bacteroidota bacterium]